MTTNFGCRERRTMASQPSAHNEERNLLRIRAWEQRNQETSQAKELNHQNVPLFGEPYKTNKEDELSSLIQKMLGRYEDVNDPDPIATDPLPIPTHGTISQSEQGQQKTDNQTKPPFHNQVHCIQSQKAPASNSYSSQPTRTPTAAAAAAAAPSPSHRGDSSTLSNISTNHSQLSQSAHQPKKSEANSDLSLSQEMSRRSPDTKLLPFLPSRHQDNTDADTKDAFDRHQLEGSADRPPECASAVDVSALNVKQSPKDASLPQANKTNALPSQTFPSLLSKQPSVVMTQKPTAYVRPMDGQDHVVSESPELKLSPEPYVTLPELISKSDLGKAKILPQFLEPQTNEAQCVEDILREMTSWPPLLTAIHTPCTGEPSKPSLSSKGAEHVSSCPAGQKTCKSSPSYSSQRIHQSSSSSFGAAHSKGVESTSSSDSESSSRSESDSEGTAEEQPQHPVGNSVPSEPEAPGTNHVDWQLGNWIRSSQHSSSTEVQSSAHASQSPAPKQPLLTQSSKHGLEGVEPSRESKPYLPSQQKEFTDSYGKPQTHSESPQDSCKQQSSSQTSPSTDVNSCSRKLSCTTYSSIPAKAGVTEAALGVKCEEGVAVRDKDPCLTDRPKVKTKSGHGRKSKDGRDAKRDSKRTKRASLDKRTAGSQPEGKLTLCGPCPSCGVQYPNPCSCPTQSPARPDQLSPAPPVRLSCSKPKPKAISLRGTKSSHKTTHKHLGKAGHAAKSSRDPHRSRRSLVVKFDLSLLLKVPQTPGNLQEMLGKAKRTALLVEQHGRGSDAPAAQKVTKTSRKSIPPNVEADDKAIPRKKPRLENKNTSSSQASVKLKSSSNSSEGRERKKAKKNPLTPKEAAKDSKLHKRSSGEVQETSKEAGKSKDPCKHKRRSRQHAERPPLEKPKPAKSSVAVPSSSQPTREALTNRPLLRLEDRQYPVKHYIKEAKKLKHKADAESDKVCKAFSYLDAAMFFVESGVAMEKDPQISMSSYTMFAETVKLLKFVLRLKNSSDPAAPPSEKDFAALCLKCQALLHMAMFHQKHKTALKYSKMLTDHFANSAQRSRNHSVLTSQVTDSPSPMPSMPSPANTSTSSGPGSNHSGSGSAAEPVGSTVAVPQAVEQVAFNYVNITSLFLNAYDIWEQAEELAQKGSGMLTELDAVLGPLSLTSSMTSMVRYTRQGVDWLRLDSRTGN